MANRECDLCRTHMSPYMPRTKKNGLMVCPACLKDDRGGYVSAAKGCHCGGPGHTSDEHPEWAEARHAEGTHDAWGRPLHQAYDGHGAWNCNNYSCAEHPQEMYDEPKGSKPAGMPGWMEHDMSPDRDVQRAVNKAFHETGQHEDARYLMNQQGQGPSKFSHKMATWSQERHPQPMVHVMGEKPQRPLMTGDKVMHPSGTFTDTIVGHSESMLNFDKSGWMHRGPVEGDRDSGSPTAIEARESTWIGDHIPEEPSLYWRAPNKRWEVHVKNCTPDRDLREGYGATPHQDIELHNTENGAKFNFTHAPGNGGTNRTWEHGERRIDPWGTLHSRPPEHVMKHVDRAIQHVHDNADTHAELYGRMADQDDIRKDLARVPKDMENEQKAHNMFNNLMNKARDDDDHTASRKTARQQEIDMKYAPTARLVHTSGIQTVAHDSGDGETIYHCPFCGSGQVLARSDGTVECEFCHTAFTVQVQPEMSAFPQTINGVPVDVPGMPGEIGSEAPMNPADLDPGAETGAPGDGGAPPAPGEGDEPDAGEDSEEGGNPFTSSLRTATGAQLPLDDYLKHLAILHANDRAVMIARIRKENS